MAAAFGERAAWRSLSAGVACLTGGMAVATAPRPTRRHIADDKGRALLPPLRPLGRGWHLSAPALHCDEKTKAILAVARRGPFSDIYEVEEKIGDGVFGTLHCARNRLTDTHRAVKTVRKDNVLDYQAFKKKLEDLFDLNHPRLIKLVGFLEDDEEAHLVFELCTGPDLFDKMLEIRESGQRMPLQEVRHMLRQMMQAVVACKEHGLVHRDIRPENFMIESREKQGLDSSIKFIDLGLSREEFVKDKPCTGPLLYTAPECIKGQYGERSDTWSLGAIFFLMITGGTLFDQQNCEDGLSKMLESEYCPRPWLGKIKPDTHHWVTEDAIDLLRRMVKTNPVERISVEEALQHPFMSCSMEEFQEQQTLRFPTALLGKIEPWTHRWVTGDAKDLFWSLVETGMCVEDALPQAFMACTAQSFEERGCGISLTSSRNI